MYVFYLPYKVCNTEVIIYIYIYIYIYIIPDVYPKAKYGPAFEAIRHTFHQDKACSLFCKGKECKFDNAEWPSEQMAINGLYSSW